MNVTGLRKVTGLGSFDIKSLLSKREAAVQGAAQICILIHVFFL